MKNFKFLSKDNKVPYRTPIEYLKEYLRRLDCNYCNQFNIFNETSPLWVPSNNFYIRTLNFFHFVIIMLFILQIPYKNFSIV